MLRKAFFPFCQQHGITRSAIQLKVHVWRYRKRDKHIEKTQDALLTEVERKLGG